MNPPSQKSFCFKLNKTFSHMSSLKKEKHIHVNKRSALFLKPVTSHHQFNALTVCLCRRCSACLSVSADWLKQQQKTIIRKLIWSLFFFFLFLCLIGRLGLSPGILVTHRPADVTALHNEVCDEWVSASAFVNNQAGKFTGDKSDNEGHVCHDVI